MLSEIYVKRYNNKERVFKEEETIFDQFEAEELLTEEQALSIYAMYTKALHLHNNEFELSPDTACDIVKIKVPSNPSYLIASLREQLLQQAVTVSGDDDAYDYFPDLVYVFNQVCQILEKPEEFNRTVPTLNRILDVDADDERAVETI